jgi:LCP family protein required for cell wall assembly
MPRISVPLGVAFGMRVAVAALSLAVLLGSGFAWATYRSFTSDIRRVQIPLGGAASTARNIDGDDQNILVVGNDDRSTATPAELKLLGTTTDGGTLNTDTMMLLHVPANGSKATVISFPRDAYVVIPGFGQAKLNAAYPDGVSANHGSKSAGAALLVQTIENLTGLTVDHFVQVDLLGFYRISNAIGKVTVCLKTAQRGASYVGEEGPGIDAGKEPDGTWVSSYTGINLKKGTNNIQGSQALAFVRQRHGLPDGDLDRIKRQQTFLSAVFRKLVSGQTLLNPFRLESLLKAVSSSLTMDQSYAGHPGLDPLKLAQQMQNLSAGNVTFTTIPLSGAATIDGVGDVELVDSSALSNVIDTLIGEDPRTALAKAKAVPASSVTVDVLNGSGVAGRATRNAQALESAGFKVTVGAGDPGQSALTSIRYPKGMEGQAKTLAVQITGAKLLRAGDVKRVTLMLGADNVQVASLLPRPVQTSPPRASPTQPSPVQKAITAADTGCIN